METSIESEIIEYLLYAERDVHEVNKITDVYPEISVGEAYRIQEGLLQKRLKEKGTETVGIKLELPKHIFQDDEIADQPIYGFLHKDMLAYEWEPLPSSELIHPKVEPEIAFFIGEDINGEAITEEAILQATKYVAPALEIVDSRFKDFQYTLPDMIADNCSSAKFVIGSNLKSPDSVDLANLGIVLSKNGKVEKTGSTSAVLGHPLRAMTNAAKLLLDRGRGSKKGDIVLSGAISRAISINSGDKILAEFDSLGTVSIYCK